MKLADRTIEGKFVRRVSRFSALVKIGRGEHLLYVPNSDRLRELLYPGNQVLLTERPSPDRKTGYDLAIARHEGTLVSVDARIPNLLVQDCLVTGRIPELRKYSEARREVSFRRSRLDFALGDAATGCLMEVKSVTLVRDGRAYFPDAPTLRGTRHLRDLLEAAKSGREALVFFCVQRDDARTFSPNDATDPEFGRALRSAAAGGVGLLAYSCRVTETEIELCKRLLILL